MAADALPLPEPSPVVEGGRHRLVLPRREVRGVTELLTTALVVTLFAICVALDNREYLRHGRDDD